MKLLRPIAIALLLVGAFFYFTTYRSGSFRLVNSPIPKVEITEAAGTAARTSFGSDKIRKAL